MERSWGDVGRVGDGCEGVWSQDPFHKRSNSKEINARFDRVKKHCPAVIKRSAADYVVRDLVGPKLERNSTAPKKARSAPR